jgi:hypothetical protein
MNPIGIMTVCIVALAIAFFAGLAVGYWARGRDNDQRLGNDLHSLRYDLMNAGLGEWKINYRGEQEFALCKEKTP